MRHRRMGFCLSCLLAMAAMPGIANGQAKNDEGRVEFSDANVEQAIQRGAEYLWSKQQGDGSWGPYKDKYPGGYTALATYALLESGVKPTDPRMAKALKWMLQLQKSEQQRLSGLPEKGGLPKNFQPPKTYTLGLRCQAWLSAVHKGGSEYLPALRTDVDLLVHSTKNGSYSYNSSGRPSGGDNSNSQYGVLGVWAGALAGLELPQEYWIKVMTHWLRSQNADGGWSYNRMQAESPSAMTTAGIASLFLCYDNLLAEAFVRCNTGERGRLIFAAAQRGLDWFDRNFSETIPGLGRRGKPQVPLGHSDMYYYLYGVERIGLASGYKYFGTEDWYKVGATWLLNDQQADGSWKGKWGQIPATTYAMVFLIRGRRPVLFNKLQFEGDWNNRPRDMASLARWMSRAFETDVYWQIINLKVPPREWHDAPIVYISGSQAPKFSDDDLDKLRRFVWQGGTIFSVTECNGGGFETGMRETYRKLFPDYDLAKCGPDHEMYTVRRISGQAGRIGFHLISNGVRPIAVHTTADLPLSWQLQRSTTDKWAFEAAANVFLYVTDRTFRARGTTLWPEEPGTVPKRTVKLARLAFEGNDNPEPLAYERFANLMHRDYGTEVNVLGPMPPAKLAESGAKIAAMTGTGKLALSDDDQQALARFVEDGGTLVIDAAGGDREFDRSAETLLRDLFGRPARLDGDARVFRLPGLEIEDFRYRRLTRERIGGNRPNLRGIQVGGRMAVYYSREDITAGLVGYPSYRCDGYDPGTAFALMRNLVLLASPSGGAASTTRPAEAPEEQPAKKAGP